MSAPPPPPPPPPPSQPYGGAGGRPAFDPKTVNQKDWIIMGAGVLAFIFSLFDWYSYQAKDCGSYCGGTYDQNAWNGFFGWFGVLLALIGAAAVAISLFAPQVNLPAPARLIGLGAFALAFICVLLSLFVIPDASAGGISIDSSKLDTGHDFGYWISLIVVAVGLVVSFLRFQETGGTLPNRRAPMA